MPEFDFWFLVIPLGITFCEAHN